MLRSIRWLICGGSTLMFNHCSLISGAATLISYKAILISQNATLMFGNETLMPVDQVLMDEDMILISMLGLLRLGLAFTTCTFYGRKRLRQMKKGLYNISCLSIIIVIFVAMSTLLDSGVKPYNHYGAYLKEKYKGQRVFKVIVDGNFTCPNRDGSKGYGGCTYCNVDSFTPDTARKIPSIREQVESGIERARRSYAAEKFIIYFQPNTNTYAPTHLLKMMYDEALSIDPENTLGLSVGTRPDCLDFEKIALLESYTDRLDVDLEMGMESIHNDTLERINRGCSHDEFLSAMRMLENTKLELCVHTIFGFPWETEEMMLAYAEEINRQKHIKFVKLHHLHIVEGSIMGVKYKREPFKLFTIDEYTDFLAKFIPLLRPDIIIQRIFGIADRELLIAPNWGYPKSKIQTHIDKGLESRGVKQGSLYFG